MAPQTRSSANTKGLNGSAKVKKKHTVPSSPEPVTESESDGDMLESMAEYIPRLSRKLAGMKAALSSLRDNNAKLTERLINERKTRDVSPRRKREKRSERDIANLQEEIRSLKAQVSELHKVQKKDKKKILQLQIKEVKRDAAELQEDEDLTEAGDSAYPMRKLLRKFSDLMAANSLDGSEECPICMEKLEVNKAISFPCQHILCETCFKEIARDKENLSCPQCRQKFDCDDVETIQHTASSQWDALLNVAARFAKIDHRGAQDTSDEEASENFLDDEQSELTSLSEHKSEDASSEPEEMITNAPSTPEPQPMVAGPSQTPRKRRILATPESSDNEPDRTEGNGDLALSTPWSANTSSLAFADSPRIEKQRRLAVLAEERERKRQRR